MERLERGNYYRKIIRNMQKSAEVVVVEWNKVPLRRRTESIGVPSMTEEGGMTDEGRKL